MPNETEKTNGTWLEYRLLVLGELRDVKADIKDIKDTLRTIEHDLTELKAKAAVWGALAAIAVTILAKLIFKV
jgi:hypothetical protein